MYNYNRTPKTFHLPKGQALGVSLHLLVIGVHACIVDGASKKRELGGVVYTLIPYHSSLLYLCLSFYLLYTTTLFGMVTTGRDGAGLSGSSMLGRRHDDDTA